MRVSECPEAAAAEGEGRAPDVQGSLTPVGRGEGGAGRERRGEERGRMAVEEGEENDRPERDTHVS